MQKTLNWVNHQFKSSSHTTKEWNDFVKDIRSDLNKLVKSKGLKVASFSKGHFDVSAFITDGEKFVYLSVGDVRFDPNWANDVLIRTAAHTKDFRGGTNDRTTIETLGAKLDIMFPKEA